MTQDQYLAILFDDCGFSGPQRRDFISLRYNGKKYTDELTSMEKHELIVDLKERKSGPIQFNIEEDSEEDLTSKERFKRRQKDY
jgi:hypothetical protein